MPTDKTTITSPTDGDDNDDALLGQCGQSLFHGGVKCEIGTVDDDDGTALFGGTPLLHQTVVIISTLQEGGYLSVIIFYSIPKINLSLPVMHTIGAVALEEASK